MKTPYIVYLRNYYHIVFTHLINKCVSFRVCYYNCLCPKCLYKYISLKSLEDLFAEFPRFPPLFFFGGDGGNINDCRRHYILLILSVSKQT